MKFSSFCILNETLYMCTSDVCSLLTLLKSRGLDTKNADQGRIYHTDLEYYLIICSPDTQKIIKEHLKSILKGKLHFEGADIPSRNKHIKKIDYIDIAEDVFVSVSILKEHPLS